MLMNIITKIKRKLFGNNIKFNIDYIKEHQSEINYDICREINIKSYITGINNHTILINEFSNNLNKITDELDTKTNNTLDYEFLLRPYSEFTLLDFMTINSRVPSNVSTIIIDMINTYSRLIDIVPLLDRSNGRVDYNLNIIHSYIITMESIIKGIYRQM